MRNTIFLLQEIRANGLDNQQFDNLGTPRKVFGPTRTNDGYCRIKTNQEINDILKGQNIIRFIKKQRLNWLGHVERMAEDNTVQKIKRWKPTSKRPIERPKTRWEDDVLEDIKSVNIRNLKKVAQNRDSWKKVVEHVTAPSTRTVEICCYATEYFIAISSEF